MSAGVTLAEFAQVIKIEVMIVPLRRAPDAPPPAPLTTAQMAAQAMMLKHIFGGSFPRMG